MSGATDDDFFMAEDVEPADALVSESLAQKLQRIRDVVSSQDDDAIDVDYDEDIEAPAALNGFGDMDALTPDSAPAATETPVVAQAAQDIEEALALDNDTEAHNAAAQSVPYEADDLESILRRIEADGDGDGGDEDGGAPLDLSTEVDGDEPAENLFDPAGASADETEAQGRVMKVDRAALDAALQAGDLEEYADENLSDAPVLNAAEEAQLQRDLAALKEAEESANAAPSREKAAADRRKRR